MRIQVFISFRAVLLGRIRVLVGSTVSVQFLVGFAPGQNILSYTNFLQSSQRLRLIFWFFWILFITITPQTPLFILPLWPLFGIKYTHIIDEQVHKIYATSKYFHSIFYIKVDL